MSDTLYKLCYYVPEESLEATKEAIFNAGAGKMDTYDRCCFQSKGEGQFRPLQGSDPHIGQTDQLETVTEYRVETVCPEHVVEAVIRALREAHPYEVPAIDLWALAPLPA